MTKERIQLTPEEAESILPKGKEVHTFRNPAGILLGCDWSRKDILKTFKKHPPELAGPGATEMGHGIVLDDGSPLFVATDADALNALLAEKGDA